MNKIVSAFSGLPRAARWLAVTGAVIVLYFFVVEPVIDRIISLDSQADALARGLARERELASPSSADGRVLGTGLTNFGRPVHPTDRLARAETLHRIVNDIFDKHDIRDRATSEKTAIIRGETADALVPPGSRLERFVLDVTFETDPKTLTAILADLEQSPEVAAVSRVRIDKPSSGGRNGSGRSTRMVRATISPEIWVVDYRGGAQ